MKKYKGLYKQYHKKTNQEYVDVDYVDKLTDEEKEWLANFLDSHYGSRFTDNDVARQYTDEERKKAYRENNARRRDMSSDWYKSSAPAEEYTDRMLDGQDPELIMEMKEEIENRKQIKTKNRYEVARKRKKKKNEKSKDTTKS